MREESVDRFLGGRVFGRTTLAKALAQEAGLERWGALLALEVDGQWVDCSHDAMAAPERRADCDVRCL